VGLPQHCLYFFPDPQAHGSLRPTRDVELTRIMDVIWHRDVRTVTGYVRRGNLFKGHAGASFV
jgi:hypothetical protein